MGRPSDYSEELAIKICEYITDGLSLRQIKKIDGMPDVSTIMRWCVNNESFREQYTRAKEFQTEAFNEELPDISDDENIPVDRARLMIETRKWIMGKMKPKKYGDKQQVDHSGTMTLGQLVLDSYKIEDKGGE